MHAWQRKEAAVIIEILSHHELACDRSIAEYQTETVDSVGVFGARFLPRFFQSESPAAGA
jgi:hypothetical protein